MCNHSTSFLGQHLFVLHVGSHKAVKFVLFLIAPGAVIESSTTTVTRKQQEFVISGNQVVEDTEVIERNLAFITPLPSVRETDLNQTVR